MSKLEALMAELCPNGVEVKTLADICVITRGRVMSKDYLRDNAGIYPVYSSQTTNNGIFGYIDNYDYDYESITWTTDGANAGSVFYHINEKFSITNVCGLLRVLDQSQINTRFLYYCLQVTTKRYVNTGMGNPKLMSNVMAGVTVPLPPLPVQREIVRILDNFTELTAELTAELSARKKQYEYYRNELLSFGDEVEWKTLGSVCVMKAGKSIAATNISEIKSVDSPYPCYGGNGLRGYVKTFNQVGEAPLIGRQGALCGNVCFAAGKYYATEHAIVVAHGINYNPRFLYHLLIAMDLNQYKTAGAQPGLSVAKLEKIMVPVPPLEDQARIVAILDRFDTLCNDLSSGLPAEIAARQQQYEYYRDQLLSFPVRVDSETEVGA